MRTLKLIIIGCILFFTTLAQAQVSVNVHINAPPMWGPVGYTHVNYYYLPDVEAYYDVPASMFIYYEGGIWVHRAYLPSRYRNYDLYGGYKVVMTDYHGHTPYTEFKAHKMKYGKGYHGQSQRTIGERPGKGGHDNYKNNEHGHDNNMKEDHGHDQHGKEDHGHDKNSKEGHGGHDDGKGKK
jgi:hypothetical protein